MAAPVKRPHLSFSVEAILSLSKKMRKENDTKEEDTKEIGAGTEELEESTPDSTSQTNLVDDNVCDKVPVEEKEVEENIPDSTSPEKDAKKEESRLKPGVLAVGDVQVNFRFMKYSPSRCKRHPQCRFLS